jgi:hypothetical protein
MPAATPAVTAQAAATLHLLTRRRASSWTSVRDEHFEGSRDRRPRRHGADVLDDSNVRINLHRQFARHLPFGKPERHSSVTAYRAAIETDDGEMVAQRRAAFADHTSETPWDGLHLGYFAGYRMWTYRASIVSGGELWGIKGLMQDPAPRQMTVALHRESAAVQPFGSADHKTDFTRDRIAIENLDGRVVRERTNRGNRLRGTS